MVTELSLTHRQTLILEVIRRDVLERGIPPSIREIGERVGLSSSSSVHCHLRTLEQKGFIRRDPSRPRCIELLAEGRSRVPPAAPRAAAPADGDQEGSGEGRESGYPAGITFYPVLEDPNLAPPDAEPVFIPLPRDLAGGDDAFLFQVEGDSMREAAILHGDLVIARRSEEAEDGDIVVVLANQEITVKRFFHGNGHSRLEPENRRMKPIFVRDARVLGKVVGIIRRIY